MPGTLRASGPLANPRSPKPIHRHKKKPGFFSRRSRAYTWRRPTLAGSNIQLPSALQRFTAGFGMGPGGSTTLWPPECNPVSDGTEVLATPALAGRLLSDIHVKNIRSQRITTIAWLRPWKPRSREIRNQVDRMISTGELNTLLHLHRQPINVVVFHDPSGRTHLGSGLALRCFQRLSIPHLAAQRCP